MYTNVNVNVPKLFQLNYYLEVKYTNKIGEPVCFKVDNNIIFKVIKLLA